MLQSYVEGHDFPPPTTIFQVDQAGGICKDGSTTLLYLLSFWVPTALAALTLGSSAVRRRLGCCTEYRNEAARDPASHDGLHVARTVLSVSGSFLLHAVVWACIAARVLSSDGGGSDSFGNAYWAWSVRPLPATFVLVLALADPALFLESAVEMQVVEALLGALTVGVYNGLRLQTYSDWADPATGDALSAQAANRVVYGGAVAGITFWSLCLPLVAAVLVLGCAGKSRAAAAAGHALAWWAVVFNLVRACAGFAVWGGAASLDPGAFCPRGGAEVGLLVGWAAVTVLDHLWRGLFAAGRMRWLGLEALATGRFSARPGWPVDVTYDGLDGKDADVPLAGVSTV